MYGSISKDSNFDVFVGVNGGWRIKASKELIRGDKRENDIKANHNECDYNRSSGFMAETAK